MIGPIPHLRAGGMLFSVDFSTLDSLIHPDDPVRLVDEILEGLDWSLWEAEYPRHKGQPRNNQKQLDKSCFVYVAAEDQYDCPQGHPLPFEKTKPEERGGETIQKRIYRCVAWRR